ncbi:MAG: hypothetical protein R6T98_11885 [Desulfatiglandales bacterium]
MTNPAIFTILKKTMDFFEVTGERVLSFGNVSVGEPAGPDFYRGNAEGFRLGEPPARRGQNSPMDTLLKRPTREPRN